MTHSLPFSVLIYCESVVLYIILLEVAHKFWRLCKMVRRSKVVGPRCLSRISTYFQQLNRHEQVVWGKRARWMRNSFLANLNEVDDEEDFKELINLRTDNWAKIKFSSFSLSCFWVSQLQIYNAVAMMHCKKSFTSLLEARVSRLVIIESKYRNRMDVRRDIHLDLFKTKPNISKLIGECC